MNKKYFYGGIALLILFLAIFVMPNYFTGNASASDIEISGDIEKIEIIHFHGTNQCSSCIKVGDLAEKTINTYFEEELKSGEITFAHINGELAKNREKAMKYGATGSSLWIGTYYSDGTFKKEENTNVWYKINDEEAYLDYLKDVIEEKLRGN